MSRHEIVRDVTKELEALRVMREQIADLAGGDEDFVRDTLEGEADFEGLVRRLLMSIGEDEAHAAGVKDYIAELAERKRRHEDRAATKRALLATALEISGRKSIPTDIATVTLRQVTPTAIVVEEGDIPASFWEPQPPKLDKKALTAALRDGEAVPGATLSNGGISVTIRRA